tara:strand:+ start:413 stop:649 length:237 start_codon:yes stop_codon:yes gene_type:complete
MKMRERLVSRKLWITIGIIVLVAVSDMLGSPLDDSSLEAVITMGLGLLGAQGLVDTAAAFSAGKKIAAAVEESSDEQA